MKRFYSLLICALLLLAACPASANSWNLSGGHLLNAISSDHKWNDYIRIGNQAGDVAVMQGCNHNALMVVLFGSGAQPDNKRLEAYTKAVYQPEDGRDSALTLTKTEDGFTLAYGDDERYTFALMQASPFAEAEYYLTEAAIGAFSMRAVIEWSEDGFAAIHYEAKDPSQSAVCGGQLTLRRFNIDLFPRSIAEIRHLNHMRAALDSGLDCFGWWENGLGERVAGVGKGTAPVYSAPFGASAFRAADGKAAVGLEGELWRMGGFTNADGESYARIRYDVNLRAQRIGYVPASVFGEANQTGETLDDFIHVDLRATRDTYLTDDPDVSQAPQFFVPQGTWFDCMGVYNDDYAYVAAEVKNGAFVAGGAIVWGFVPLKALELNHRGEIQTEAMNALLGEWFFYAGGNQAEDELNFRADGTYTGKSIEETHGTWYVTAYNPFQNLYWNDPPYEITLIRDDGTVTVKGLTLNENGSFSLTFWEGGGGYILKGADPEAYW